MHDGPRVGLHAGCSGLESTGPGGAVSLPASMLERLMQLSFLLLMLNVLIGYTGKIVGGPRGAVPVPITSASPVTGVSTPTRVAHVLLEVDATRQ